MKATIILFVFFSIILSSCEILDTSPADKFVGSYNCTIKSNLINGSNIWCNISKISSNRISIAYGTGNTITYSVKYKTITEESGYSMCESQGNLQYNPVYYVPDSLLYNEYSTGTIKGNKITINGTWTTVDGSKIVNFTIIATK